MTNMEKIIRESKLEDIERIAFLAMRTFNKEGILNHEDNDINHWINIATICHSSTLTKVCTYNDIIIGGIGAFINPSILSPKIHEINVIAQWVSEEYRNTTVYHRLFKSFMKDALSMVNQGKARRIIMCDLLGHTNINYERLGFTKVSSSYTIGD